jgi:hypothetical protein
MSLKHGTSNINEIKMVAPTGSAGYSTIPVRLRVALSAMSG